MLNSAVPRLSLLHYLLLIVLAYALEFASCQAAEMNQHKEIALAQTIALPNVRGRIDHMSFDPKSGRLYVAALGNNTVEVLDTRAGKHIKSISGLDEPQGVAFVPSGDVLFVANGNGGRVDIFETSTFSLVQSLNGLPDADNLRYDASSGRMLVGYGKGAIRILDARTTKTLDDIKLAAHPESFRLERSRPRLYVNVPTARHVAFIDLSDRSVSTWPLKDARANFPMALDEVHHRLFIATREPPQMIVYDTEAGKPLGAVAISGDADDLFVDDKSGRVYISCGAGFIDVVSGLDAERYKLIDRIATRSGARTSLWVPETRRLYLALPMRDGQSAEVRAYEMQ